MAVGVPEYTGREAGSLLPKFSGEKLAESQEKMFQTVLETEKFKYGERKKEEAEFLKNIYIKPEYIISTAARTKMANDLQAFSDKWYKINKQYKGIMPFEQKVQMQNERALLESTQNDLLQNMGQWKVLNEAVVKDGGVNYDEQEWQQITSEFMRTGQMPVTSPPIKGYDFASYLRGESKKITTEYPAKPMTSDKGIWRGTTNIQEDAINNFIKDSALKDPRAIKGLAQEFVSLPIETKRIYLEDLNRDRVLDDKDIDDNAIIRWAIQNPKFREAAVNRQGTWTNVPRPRADTSVGATRIGGVDIKMSPGVQTTSPNQRTVGVYDEKEKKTVPRVYSKYTYVFNQNLTLQNIKTVGSSVLYGSWTGEGEPGSVNAKLILYDPQKKVFVVETTTGSESLDLSSRVVLEIPRENITDYERIPLELGGSKLTVGESDKVYSAIQGGGAPSESTTTTTPTTTGSGVIWK